MKKLISTALAAAFILSLSACRTNNVGMENKSNNISDNGTTNIGSAAGTDEKVVNNYKDGAYIGFGNGHGNLNEKAIVMIRNGRITDIYLTEVDQNEAENFGNVEGSANNNQPGNETGFVNQAGPNYPGEAGTNYLPGKRAGAAVGNTAGYITNDVRTNLVNAMLQHQTPNVNMTTNDNTSRATVDNWKLAVSRALDQARQ